MEDFKIESLSPADEGKPLRLPQFSTALKVVALAVAVLLIGGGSLYVFGRSQFSEQKIEFTVSGPDEVAAGDEAVFVVRYENTNRAAIENVRLVFSYPVESLPLHDGAPVHITQEELNIGTIPAHEKGERQFQAIIVGHQGNVKTARAVLGFSPEHLTTQLQVSAEATTTITTMPVELNIVAPPTVLSGQTVTYTIDYKNQTPETLRNLELHVRFPDGFTATKPKTTWEIPTLEAGESSRITVTGTIIGNEREVKTIFIALQKEVVTSTSRFVIEFEKADASSVISTPLLSAAIGIKGSREYTAHTGDTLSYTTTITNTTDVDLTSLVLTVRLDGSMYDMSTIDGYGGSFDGRLKTITWNSSVVPELGFLRAHQSVTVLFSVTLKNSFPSTLQVKDSFIKASAHVETVNVPESLPVDSLSAADELITRITTSPSFSQSLIVDDTQFGASTPYPPKVDQTTTFTVKWSVANPSNGLTPAKVTGILLPGVTWKGMYRVAGGTQAQPVYDSKTSTITWNLNTVPPGTGIASPPYELFFQVSITPSVNEARQTPTLVSGARFEGTDVLTQEEIVLTQRDLTTQSAVQP
ncbi:MAG: hypothetical protein AAB420_01910 [Patescibacteria group bacterium]